MKRTVVVAGHACVDLMPQLAGGERIAPGRLTEVGPLLVRPGGCVSNTGGVLAELGAAVRLVANVGDDELGRLLHGMLTATGADASGIRPAPDAGTSYSIVFDPPEADRAFWHHPGANAFFDASRVTFSEEALVHLGYPTALRQLYVNGGVRLVEFLARARRGGLTCSVDLSTVAAGSEAAAVDWQELLAKVLPHVDVFTPSLDDLAAALGLAEGARHAPTVGRMLLDLGAAAVLLTDGARGMYLFTAAPPRLAAAGRCFAGRGGWSDQALFAPASQARRARTTGAGDAATAGLLHGILTGSGPSEALGLAAAVASRMVRGQAVTDAATMRREAERSRVAPLIP